MILALATAPLSAQDFTFDPNITDEQFRVFSAIVGQSVYASPINPATERGLLAFDIGVAVTALPVDEEAAYWVNAVDADILTGGYLPVPRVVVSKGLSVITVAGSYARIPDTDVEVWGGSVDVPLLGGGLATPSLSVRGAYSEIRGIEELQLKTYGAELFVGKAFGPITPYAGAGITRTESEGTIPATQFTPLRVLTSELDQERFTVGVRISLLFPKITLEATQAEDLAYSAKISLGF